jgi:hypothetical protein
MVTGAFHKSTGSSGFKSNIFFSIVSPSCKKMFREAMGSIAEPAKGADLRVFDGSGVAKGRAPEERARRD